MIRSEQRRLAVIDVAQERDDRRTFDQICRIVFLLLQLREQLIFQADSLLEFDIDAELRGHEFGHIRIHDRGDRGHDAFVHENPQDFAGRHAGRFR